MNRKKKIIILGTGGTSRDFLDIISDISDSKGEKLECIGFLDDEAGNIGKTINNVKVIGPLLTAKSHQDAYFVNGIGSPESFLNKEKIIAKTKIPLNRFITLTHPSAKISKSAKIGFGSVIFPNVVISSNAKVGEHVVILPNSVVSHDSLVGNYVCIAGCVYVSGAVSIGPSCYIGAGASIKESLSVGAGSLVGMGSVVINNIPHRSIYVGNPAKLLKKVI